MGQGIIFNGNYSDWNQLTITMDSGDTATANLSPTPSPTVPEMSWLVIVPLLLSIFAVALVVRHRKTANLKQ